jgi:hypothetical protein
MTKKLNDVSNPAGPARVPGHNLEQRIAKCPAFTIGVATTPTDHPKPHGHDQPMDWQILKAPFVPAVSAR